MKASLEKLQKYFKLEATRGYDNNAVVGGLERMLENWESDARADELPEEIIKAVVARIRDYSRLSPKSRAEVLEGIWRRIQQGSTSPQPTAPQEETASAQAEEIVDEAATPEEPDKSDIQGMQEPEIDPQTHQQDEIEDQLSGEPAALNASITVIAGIGVRTAQIMERLGLMTLKDMLYFFPRRYDDYSQLKTINRLQYGEIVTVIGTVESITTRKLRGGKVTVVEAVVSDGSGSLRANWFNQAWKAKNLRSGTQVVLSGKIDQYLGRLVINHPEMEYLERQQLHTNRIVPVYPLTAQIKQRSLRKQINQVSSYWAPRVQDPLPKKIRQEAGLIDLPDALLQIHLPDSWEKLKAAQSRLAFDEIFLLQLGMLSQKHAWQAREARVFETTDAFLGQQLRRLPFKLTTAQQHALADVRRDLASGRPMNRLIQGDVGSGKTIVAALGIALVTQNGSQAALMAPTSILAEQHYQNMLTTLAGQGKQISAGQTGSQYPLSSGQIRLMLGATPELEKQEIRAGLADGSIKLIIGTHALIEDPVVFADLQLAIIDEQHRFGVAQRASLRSKGNSPHLVVMTATPIPRSLALTVYGDLDLTVMDEMPPGRQPVSTHVLMPIERERAYTLIQGQIQQGRQAFIIYPLVEESENSQSKAATEEFDRLQKDVFQQYKVGLLHGRMKASDKDTVMTAFRDAEYQILVSTTVVEVGVDVPNATVMLIEGSNRFGLAQLHQLRGRVGRSSDKAYCLLIPDKDDEIENERLKVMAETNDGFVLAEKDLEQRGPGQFLGTRQSGFAELQIATLTDIRLIEKARQHAQELFEQDPELSQPEHSLLAEFLQRSWSNDTGDVS
ncbi:ATP-dependent DNA helicase RecG [Chloroflexota bacterium]